MTRRILAVLVLAMTLGGAGSQGEEMWKMTIHKGPITEEHFLAEIDSLTFHAIDTLICDPGYGNCDGDTATGCETHLATDVNNCGACGHICDLPHTLIHICSQGECLVSTCDTGHGNCNGIDEDGCEADLLTDVYNCGTCGHDCTVLPRAATTFCEYGICQISTCDAGWGDCDDDPTNGCERDLYSDENNCGTCGHVCDLPHTSAHDCVLGECQVSTCDAHYADCNATHVDGCESCLGDVTNTENDCFTAIDMGSVCGDEGMDFQTQAGRGSKWYTVEVEECNGLGTVDLSVAIVLSSPSGADYDLRTYLGTCESDEQWATGGVEDCIEYGWTDLWSQPDGKSVYIEVYHESGSACGDYTLTVVGNTTCQ